MNAKAILINGLKDEVHRRWKLTPGRPDISVRLLNYYIFDIAYATSCIIHRNAIRLCVKKKSQRGPQVGNWAKPLPFGYPVKQPTHDRLPSSVPRKSLNVRGVAFVPSLKLPGSTVLCLGNAVRDPQESRRSWFGSVWRFGSESLGVLGCGGFWFLGVLGCLSFFGWFLGVLGCLGMSPSRDTFWGIFFSKVCRFRALSSWERFDYLSFGSLGFCFSFFGALH